MRLPRPRLRRLTGPRAGPLMTGRVTGSLPALMYHAVGSVMPRGLEELSVPASLLAEHLDALRGAGHDLVGLTDALARPGGSVAVTFDDGYLDFLDALPVLDAAGARATLYQPTRDIGGTASWLPGAGALLPLLDRHALGEVVAHGVEVGSHGAVHVPLDVLPARTSAEQLTESKERLEEITQRPVVSFCYPHGYHSRGLRRRVRAAGYANACAIGHRLHAPEADRFAVSRVLVGPHHSGDDVLRLVAEGSRWAAPGAKRLATPTWRLARRAALLGGATWR